MKNLVNTREALAVAIFAFRQNGKVAKDVTQCKDGQFPNKMQVHEHFTPAKTNNPLPIITVTDELLKAADDVKTVISHAVTMSMLTKGRIQPFLENIHNCINDDTIHAKYFGVLVWAPKLAEDLKKAQSLKEISSAYELTSKFFGKEGEKLELDFNLIEKRFVRSLGIWSAYGHTADGNLVKFLSKHEDLCASQKIKARVKNHDTDKYHNNARVTSLNFVKAI